MVQVRKRISLCEATTDVKKQNRTTLPHPLRKVRIIVNDPYATDDSSSDEEEELKPPRKVKRIIHEINFTSLESSLVPKTISKEDDDPPKKHVGVRQRKWGKWAAEIRHPITKTRDWLGTYNTHKEAVKVYDDKRAEFDALVANRVTKTGSVVFVSKNLKVKPDDVSSSETSRDTSASALTSVSSADDLLKEEITSNANGVDSSKEMLFDFNFADLQIPDNCFFAEGNEHDLDFDYFLKDDQLDWDMFSDIHGFEDNCTSELPDFDFADDEEHGVADSSISFLDIPCPMKSFAAS